MSHEPETTAPTPGSGISHRFFANFYERASHDSGEAQFMQPLRREVAGLARGVTLEIGAGNGLNFAFYDPARVTRVEATEPDSHMLVYARDRAAAAPVPVNLVQAAVERLPFADATFDSAVVTLVFCSVGDPLGGLSEARRVLKPGGALLMVEHIRAHNALGAAMQTAITPLTRLVAGNCHWNRDTEKTVREAGFTIEQAREIRWSMLPFVVIHAVR